MHLNVETENLKKKLNYFTCKRNDTICFDFEFLLLIFKIYGPKGLAFLF